VGGKGLTLATQYIQFYLNLLLKLVPHGGIVVSHARKALCHLPSDQSDLGFKAEEYTDTTELQALCSLIGAFGVKQLSDNLMTAVAASAIEMKRLVTESKTELDIIRSKTHLPDQCTMAYVRLLPLTSTARSLLVNVLSSAFLRAYFSSLLTMLVLCSSH